MVGNVFLFTRPCTTASSSPFASLPTSPPPDSPTLMSALSMNAASMAPVMLDVVLHTVGGGGGE